MHPARLVAFIIQWSLIPFAAAAADHSLLLAVGDVSDRTARVLYDALDASLYGGILSVSWGPTGGSQERLSCDVPVSNGPQVLVLNDLRPRTAYTVRFLVPGGPEEVAHFRTFQPRGEEGPLRLLAVSCDRWLEDGDDSGWLQLLDRETDYDGIVHLGDQMYADALFKDVPDNVTAEGALRLYRSCYRRQWGRPLMQRVLRRGAHWMLPDDHDVVNNLNWFHLMGCTDADCVAPSAPQGNLVRAGLRALGEYQLQLNGPLDGDPPPAAHFALVLGRTALLFVDTRVDRALAGRPGAPVLLSPSQLAGVQGILAQWAIMPNITAIVGMSSMPLALHTSLAAKVPYLFEGEYYGGHPSMAPTTCALLDAFLATNKTRLLVAGDVHFFAKSRVCRSGQCMFQMVTSGMTHMSTSIRELKLFVFHLFVVRLTSQRIGEWRWKFSDVFFARNYGWLEVDGENVAFGGVFEALPFGPHAIGQLLVTHLYPLIAAAAAIKLTRLLMRTHG